MILTSVMSTNGKRVPFRAKKIQRVNISFTKSLGKNILGIIVAYVTRQENLFQTVVQMKNV
jgi:hypothetical protein